MSDIFITGDFDYASVDLETAAKLEYFAKSGKALLRKTQIQFVADMGKILSEARDLLANHKSGTFAKWAEAEFDIGKQTIYNYVNAWDRILSNDWTIYSNWSQTALYLASADDFPKPVMKKLEKIPATDLVRTSDVKRLIEASKPKPDPDAVPFDAAPELTPAEKAKAKEAADKLRAKEAAAAEKAKAAAEKAKAKADADAARLEAKRLKEKEKADAAAAKEAERVAKEKARADLLTTDGQIRAVKNLVNQHIGKTVRLLGDLNDLKPNRTAMNSGVRALGEVKLW